MKLNVWALGLACGLLWGLGLFVLTWWVIAFDGQSTDVNFIGRVYRGFAFTPTGSFIGLAWAFADGLVGGVIFAWLYNLLASRLAAKAES